MVKNTTLLLTNLKAETVFTYICIFQSIYISMKCHIIHKIHHSNQFDRVNQKMLRYLYESATFVKVYISL